MRVFPENYAVTVSVPFKDLNGAAVTPTALTAVVTDGEGVEIVDLGALTFVSSEGKKDVVVSGIYSYVEEGTASDIRILIAKITTAAGVLTFKDSWLVTADARLQTMVNSFQSMETADMHAGEIANMDGWSAATVDQRFAAMIQAFENLRRLPMKFTTTALGSLHRCETLITVADWPDLTAEDFDDFPKSFKRALRLAQVVEANEILANESFASKHRAGIISETVGESSVMLRGNIADLGVSRRSLDFLTGYLWRNAKIARA